MGAYVADAAIKQMILAGKKVKGSKVAILGLTFKENCPDTRNSKVADIINRLKQYETNIMVTDPYANSEDALKEYNINLTKLEDIKDVDCVIIAVAHDEFRKLSLKEIDCLFRTDNNDNKVLVDVKGIFDKNEVSKLNYKYWRL